MTRALIALAAAAALAAGGCGGDGMGGDEQPADGGAEQGADANSDSEASVVVEMNDALQFDPDEITVSAGDTVIWRNVGAFGHTVTADPARASDPGNVELPGGAETFDSGNVMEGEAFSHTFTEPGEYRYFCVPHEGSQMVGEVTVE